MDQYLFGDRGTYNQMEFGRLWDGFSKNRSGQQFGRHALAVANIQVDWREMPKAHIFKADVPGLKKEEMKVQVLEGRTLDISGERKKEELQKCDTWYRVERSIGTFKGRFYLPKNNNVDLVHAQLQDGVLIVTIPTIQQPK